MGAKDFIYVDASTEIKCAPNILKRKKRFEKIIEFLPLKINIFSLVNLALGMLPPTV